MTNLSSASSVSPSTTDESAIATTELKPSYSVALGVVGLGLTMALLQPWVSLIIVLFGVFLLFQTVALHLVFTATDLDIYRGETLIRRFPYQDWQNWRIFWGPLPILFYFKEVNSIHFLPMLFSPSMLQECLDTHQLPKQ